MVPTRSTALHSANRFGRLLSRLAVEVVLCGHLVGAAAYGLLAPHGFSVDHSRFWLNSVLPVVAVAATLAGLVATLRHSAGPPSLLMAAISAAWFSAAIVGRLLFPQSLGVVWWLALLVGATCALIGFAYRAFQASVGTEVLPSPARPASSGGLLLVAASAGAIVGGLVLLAQRPAKPSTRPIGWAEGDETTNFDTPSDHAVPLRVEVNDNVVFLPATGEFSMRAGELRIRCAPLLTFDRTTGDGFWSLFGAPPRDRRLMMFGEQAGRYSSRYRDGERIQFAATADGGPFEAAAYTPLEDAVFSHLNTFCELRIEGHRELSISFTKEGSPAISVRHAGYPIGDPMRVACLCADGNLRVFEAASGEKGPYRQLAISRLSPGDPLVVTLHDQGQPQISFTFDDFAAQASTAPSPTAGWGLPVNAIEFALSAKEPSAVAYVWVTLAGTSVGRGWDAVGHAAGTYRNRFTVHWLNEHLGTPAQE